MRRRERGSIFVISLAALAGIVAIVAMIAANQRMALRSETNRVELDNARMAAMDGVQAAMNELANDYQPSGSTTNTSQTVSTQPSTGVTMQSDSWAQYGSNGDNRYLVGQNSFRVQIVDQSAKLNVTSTSTTNAVLQQLPFTQEQLDSYEDWTTPGQNPHPDGGKDQYYNALTNPYNTKLGALTTFDELLQIKGFTAQDIWQPQTNVVSNVTIQNGASNTQPSLADLLTTYSYCENSNSQGTARVNVGIPTPPNLRTTQVARLVRFGISQAHATQIAARGWPSLGTMFQTLTGGITQREMSGILENLTTTAGTRLSGRINLNTASQAVLTVIPGFTADLAQTIVSQQQTGLTTLGELATLPGVTSRVLSQCADMVSVQSDTFDVRIIGTSGSTHIAIEAIVDMQTGTPKLISVQEPPYDDVIDRWQWNPQTSNDVNLEGGTTS